MKSRKVKGAALVWVICISLVLMILGSALLDITVANAKQAANSANKNQANFLARSGVNIGLNMLYQQLYDNNNNGGVTYTDRTALIYALNVQAGSGDTVIDGAGSFSLRFQDLGGVNGNIKIIGVGKTNGSTAVEDTVTLTVKLSMPDVNNIATNPADWFSSNGNSLIGINSQKVLSHNVSTSIHHLGKMVILNGGKKSVKYPQGGGSDAESTYRASIIAFKTYTDGIACLNQDSNNLNVTFDAEIIFFGDNVVSSKGKDIRITASSDVLNRPDDGILQPVEPKGKGFNDFQRYVSFVKSYNNLITNDVLHSYHDTYVFDGNYQYGIVCFKKTIPGIPSSYYFFPGNGTDGMSIIHKDNDGNILGYNGRLIKIKDDDPIIEALDIIFNNSGSCSALYWDNK